MLRFILTFFLLLSSFYFQITPVSAETISICPPAAQGGKVGEVDDPNKCAALGPTNCYTKTNSTAYTCWTFTPAYTQSICNTSTPKDKIPACTPGLERTGVLSCKQGGKDGYACNAPFMSFCTDETSNVVCQSTTPTTATNPCTDKKNCTSGGGEPCGTGEQSGIETAIGCIPTRPNAFVQGVLKFVMLASGGVAILLMILGSIQMITSEGNPESLKAAQERFYHAIIGLLFIIFSVLLLQVIGYDILGLPGFSR